MKNRNCKCDENNPRILLGLLHIPIYSSMHISENSDWSFIGDGIKWWIRCCSC